MNEKINVSHSQNLLPFFHYFDKKGIEWKEVAKKYHFPGDIMESEYWLPSHQVMGFIHAMMIKSKHRIGLEVGRLITLEQISSQLALAIQQCSNLEQAIHRLIDLMPKLNSHVIIWPEKISGKWYLCHRVAYHPTFPAYDQTEWFRSFALISMCRQFLGRSWQPKSVFMSFSEHLANDLPPSFEGTKFTFKHDFGALEIPLPDEFKPIEADKIQSNWYQSILVLIETYSCLPWFNVDWLSTFANTSSRSIQRRFTEHECNFRELRNQARFEKGKQLLSENIPVYEVAWQCGYTDLSNFNRAFKSWAQQTPSQYQRSSRVTLHK